MLGHWVDLDPYFLHRERVLRLIRTDRAAEQLARWDPHRALTPSSPAHLATALGLALPALDTAELPRLVYEHGIAVGRLVGIEQTFCFRQHRCFHALVHNGMFAWRRGGLQLIDQGRQWRGWMVDAAQRRSEQVIR